MAYNRNTVVKIMQGWIGKNESDGSHKTIIDVYNKISPLPRSYKVTYTDAWCAATVSAAYHQAGYDAIFPSECGCSNMITKAQQMGIWVENDAYVPNPGDCILYDWRDSGVGDNTGTPDHVGMVEKVSGSTITVIEGNKNDAVERRTIAVNGKYIRGYVCPKFATTSNTTSTAEKPMNTTAEPKKVWDYLLKKIGNAYGVAGLMGNLYAESGLIPNNLENLCEQRLKAAGKSYYTDALYTAAVDNGTISAEEFLHPLPGKQYGYGLAQWTSPSRKSGLYNLAKQKNVSISNLEAQLEWLMTELTNSYSTVLKTLKSAKTVKEASDIVLTKFEVPANVGDAVKKARASYGEKYFNAYAKSTTTASVGSQDTSKNTSNATSSAVVPTYNVGTTYTIAVDNLRVRSGAGAEYSAKKWAELTVNARANAYTTGELKRGTRVTCQKTQKDSSGNIWMKIPSGWIAAYYNKKKYVQ